MATRHETNRQKERLKEALRRSCQDGTMRPGEPAPSLRHIAEEWKLSKNVVAQSLQDLIDEGLFHTIPRLGTFIGPRFHVTSDDYLVLTQHLDDPDVVQHNVSICAGFEERIAQLGGSTLCLTRDRARESHAQGVLPAVAGVLELEWEDDDSPFWASNAQPTYRVRFRNNTIAHRFDTVSFDDVDGGRKATAHLIKRGHRTIAFVGLHHLDSRVPLWSRERQDGWAQALTGAGLNNEMLAFHPRHSVPRYSKEHEEDAANEAATALATHVSNRSFSAITAVVAVNDNVAQAVLRALKAAGVPTPLWPSVIGFDDTETSVHLLTSLRLPWSDLGRAAADVLWKRRHGELQGEAQDVRVPMKMISRLTCRRDWSQHVGHVALATSAV